MTNILYCDGDSWTSGDIIDPELFGEAFSHVNHPDNDQYRLPRVWPHKLGKLLGIEIDNEMVTYLENKYRSVSAVKIVTGDILQMEIDELTENPLHHYRKRRHS